MVGRVAPLLAQPAWLDERACRHRLEVVARLRASGPRVVASLASGADQGGVYASVIEQALSVCGRLEDDLRRQLSRLAPGPLESRVDLDALRERSKVGGLSEGP